MPYKKNNKKDEKNKNIFNFKRFTKDVQEKYP